MSSVDLAILGLLSDQELHGYEVKKRLTETLGGRSSVSFGSLYPALNRLERDGSVKAVEARREPRPMPMTGSLGAEVAALRARAGRTSRDRRGKKVYGVTEGGRHRLVELLIGATGDDRTFALQMAFCHQLDAAGRAQLLEGRRAELAGALDERRAAGHDRPRYARAHLEHQAAALVQEIAWLDRLLHDERVAGDGDPQAQPAITTNTTTTAPGGTA